MDRPGRGALLLMVLAVVPIALLASPLMHRTQTVFNVPEPGTDVPLSSLTYKGPMFEAKVTTARLERKSEADADPMVAEWTFLGSNSDGQIHRVESSSASWTNPESRSVCSRKSSSFREARTISRASCR